MQFERHKTGILVLLAMLSSAGLACGASLSGQINRNSKGLALRGFDPVAYFEEGKPEPGSPEFTYDWMGARWNFKSAIRRDTFAAHPEKYAPQYGGYCAYAVSRGYLADGDPKVWKIVDGKLYLNYNDEAYRLWSKDIPGNIQKGDANWPGLARKE